MVKSLVIIPTYNERENIANIIQAVLDLPAEIDILIVDDGSPDGTAGIVKELMKEYPEKLFLLERKSKLGLGTAYIAGFKYGLERNYDYLMEMDADFSHDPAVLPEMIKAAQSRNADMVIGSRYIRGGNVKNWPISRLILSRGASFYVQVLSWMPIQDPTAGFVCYHKSVLKAIDLDKIKFVGYAFQIEMKFAAQSLGFKLLEIPITFLDRQKGTSKMNSSIIKEAVQGVIIMKARSFVKPKYYKK